MNQTSVFQFESDHPDNIVFQVLDYEAIEGLSSLYQYRIRVLSTSPGLDPIALLKYRARLKIGKQFIVAGNTTTQYIIQGQIESVKMLKSWQQASANPDSKYEYEFLLVPTLTRLTRQKKTRVFLNQSLVEIIEKILSEHQLTTEQYRLDLMGGPYKHYEFIYQYGETDLDFLRHWFERYGLYFYFEHPLDGSSEVFVITDRGSTHTDDANFPILTYQTSAGFGAPDISEFYDETRQIPSALVVQGYNYERAHSLIQVQTDIQEADTGVVHVFDELIFDEERAIDYGRILKERYLCEEARSFGISQGILVFPGKITQVRGHYCPRLNQRFLVLSIRHTGSVRKSILSRFSGSNELPDVLPFLCQFEGLSVIVQYRDAMLTPVPRIAGVIQAKLDSEGTSGHEDIDQYGRYKVAFLQEGAPEGGAGKHSNRIRKQEAYVGSGFGVHHPMAPGIEVLIAFLYGNPNLPLITGAVYNSQNKNIVSDASAYENRYISGIGQQQIVNEKDQFTAISESGGGAAIVLGNTEKGTHAYWQAPPLVSNPF